jgi:NAD(P)-dependent dehydrogenase (short-subunit alcohol dehydrogenase family)
MTFGSHSTAAQVAAGHNLRGRNAIVTGGTAGLGAETARVLASAGATVILAGRDRTKGEAAAAALRQAADNQAAIEFSLLDLGSLTSVAAFAERFLAAGRPLHLLINNAGIMAVPLAWTEDGFESQFGTNHLGHFALTTRLLPALKAAGSARVVCLTSRAHRRSDIDFDDPNYRHRPYDPWQAYGQSKTANALSAVALAAHYQTDGITANAVMPGAVATGLQGHLSHEQLQSLGWVDLGGTLAPGPDWKTIEQGAATTIWTALAPELDGNGGHYLENCTIAQPWTEGGDPPYGYYLPYALNPGRAQRLWDLSWQLIQRHLHQKD